MDSYTSDTVKDVCLRHFAITMEEIHNYIFYIYDNIDHKQHVVHTLHLFCQSMIKLVGSLFR